jgi:ABC-type multidrug transport system permease subunit
MESFILVTVGSSVLISGQPFSRVGGFMSILARVTPHTHAVEGFLKVMADGKGFVAIPPELGILLGFSAALRSIAPRRFRHV